MTKPKTYEVDSIADMARIPAARWPAFVEDLTIVVNALRASHVAFDMGPEDTLDGAMIWTDDNAPGCTLNIQDDDGETLCTIKAGKDA